VAAALLVIPPIWLVQWQGELVRLILVRHRVSPAG
jgi:hypothetical protein